MQGAGNGTVVEGIQRCFYMNIQISKRDFNKISTT
jgi:hypothetical protein